MIRYVYAYLNKKAGFFTPPVNNQFDKEMIVELAQRAFVENKGSEEHEVQKNMDLYYFGTFDDVNGVFVTLEHPEFLCSFVEEEEVKDDGGKSD